MLVVVVSSVNFPFTLAQDGKEGRPVRLAMGGQSVHTLRVIRLFPPAGWLVLLPR